MDEISNDLYEGFQAQRQNNPALEKVGICTLVVNNVSVFFSKRDIENVIMSTSSSHLYHLHDLNRPSLSVSANNFSRFTKQTYDNFYPKFLVKQSCNVF